MKRFFVDEWGPRPGAVIGAVAAVLALLLYFAATQLAQERRECIDTCARLEIEPSRDRCIWRCQRGQ